MNARMIDVKTLLVAAAAAMLLLLGAGVAYATGSGDATGGATSNGTGSNLEKAKSVALQQVNGRVTGSEVGDEEGAYQVEVTKSDGTQVDVNLDKNFSVLGTPADQEDSGDENADGKEAPEDGGG